MDITDELLPGEMKPTPKGPQRKYHADEFHYSSNPQNPCLQTSPSEEANERDDVGIINCAAVDKANSTDEALPAAYKEGGDDESFVTMQEVKEETCDFYSKLSDEDVAVDHDQPEKCPNTFILSNFNGLSANTDHDSSFRRLSHRLSRELVRRRSSLMEALPETPAGWSVLASALASALLGYELHLQQSLSCPPWTFGQCCTGDPNSAGNEWLPLQPIYDKLTESTDSLLSRPIHPSLFVGTRGTLASVAAYALWGPPSTDQHLSFRQVLTMSADGAKIALDWELPPQKKAPTMTDQQRMELAMTKGGIQNPVILILTGMNNDTSFGYIKSLQRTFTDRGWIGVAMNFRGCGIPLSTPRCYNGGYTGDLRGVVQDLASRLAPNVPLFIVGNSLSANLVTKYLGEEGFSGTLPSCVAGGVALGNPLLMHVNNLHTPWKEILALGVKKDVILNWQSFRHMMSAPSFRAAIYNTLKARTIGDIDEALAPIFIRNESHDPFAVRIGFQDAEDYWSDSSSFKYIKHISVPCLQIVAGDDMIVHKSFQKKLAHCIQNPFVMCVETKCGGHLGWQESPPKSSAFGVGTSWADRATADFCDAILKTGTFNYRPATTIQEPNSADSAIKAHETFAAVVDLPRFGSKL
jgi:predicted alpha/beta-fold hydrolase